MKKLTGLVLILVCLAAWVQARDIEKWGSTRNGTATISTDDAGTCTLTIDAISTGDFDIGATGILTLKGGGTIDNTTSASIMNLTETTVKVTGAFQTTAAGTIGTDLAVSGGDISGMGTAAIDLGETTTNKITMTASGGVSVSAAFTVGTDLVVSGGDVSANGVALDLGEATTNRLTLTATSGLSMGANGATIVNGASDTLTVTETKVDIVGTLQDDAIAVAVGNHATTQLKVDFGTCTNGQAVTFAQRYSATAPKVFVAYTAAETTATTAYASSVTTNGFTAVGQPTKALEWFSIGAR